MREKGDPVGLRLRDGTIKPMRIWKAEDSLALICSERQYDNLLRGDKSAAPIGFRWRDLVAITNDTEEQSK